MSGTFVDLAHRFFPFEGLADAVSKMSRMPGQLGTGSARLKIASPERLPLMSDLQPPC